VAYFNSLSNDIVQGKGNFNDRNSKFYFLLTLRWFTRQAKRNDEIAEIIIKTRNGKLI